MTTNAAPPAGSGAAAPAARPAQVAPAAGAAAQAPAAPTRAPAPPPGPASPPPPPPPTTPQTPINGGCQTCAVRPIAPCEVDRLKVKVISQKKELNGTKSPLPLELETNRQRHREPPPRGMRALFDSASGRLTTYDFIIETLADSPDDNKASDANAPARPANAWRLPVDLEDVVQIDQVKASYSGLACSTRAHSLLRMKVLGHSRDFNGRDEVSKCQPGAAELQLDPARLYARDFPSSSLPTEGPTAIFALIAQLWSRIRDGVKEVEFVASSCGVLAEGTTKPTGINRDLRALLRVYPREKWLVGLSFPALGTRKAHGGDMGGAVAEQGRVQAQQATSLRAARNDFMTDETRRALQQRVAAAAGQPAAPAPTVAAASGPVTFASVVQSLGEGGVPEIIVAYNDTKVGAGDLARFVRTLWENKRRLEEGLTLLGDLLAVVPQFGWRLELEAKFLSGKIVLEWGPKQIKEPRLDGRLIPVAYELKAKVQIELISFKIGASFGFEYRCRYAELVAKLEGSVELKVKLEQEISESELFGFAFNRSYTLAGSVEGKLEALATATVLGYTLVEARLTLATTLEAQLRWRVNTAQAQCGIGGSAKLNPTLLTGRIRGPLGLRRSIDPPIQILRGRDLGSFG